MQEGGYYTHTHKHMHTHKHTHASEGVQSKCIVQLSDDAIFMGGTRTHEMLITRQSTLPAELPGQLSRQGSKSTTQHKAKATPKSLCMGAQKPINVHTTRGYTFLVKNSTITISLWSDRATRTVCWEGGQWCPTLGRGRRRGRWGRGAVTRRGTMKNPSTTSPTRETSE